MIQKAGRISAGVPTNSTKSCREPRIQGEGRLRADAEAGSEVPDEAVMYTASWAAPSGFPSDAADAAAWARARGTVIPDYVPA